jgi:predicted hotdog family 3-hydroxylacyl-ACP dehydratase
MLKDELPLPEDILHHRGCVLLLHKIIEHSDEHTIASVDVSRQEWLKRQDGSVETWVAIEYMAQCFAARAGLLAYFRNEDLPRGFLIGARGLRFHVPEIKADSWLRVYARPGQGRPGLGALSQTCAVYQVEAGSNASLVAEGRLTVSTSR